MSKMNTISILISIVVNKEWPKVYKLGLRGRAAHLQVELSGTWLFYLKLCPRPSKPLKKGEKKILKSSKIEKKMMSFEFKPHLF